MDVNNYKHHAKRILRSESQESANKNLVERKLHSVACNIVCSTPLNTVKRNIFDDMNSVSPIRENISSQNSSPLAVKLYNENNTEVLTENKKIVDESIYPLPLLTKIPIMKMVICSSDTESASNNELKKTKRMKKNLKTNIQSLDNELNFNKNKTGLKATNLETNNEVTTAKKSINNAENDNMKSCISKMKKQSKNLKTKINSENKSNNKYSSQNTNKPNVITVNSNMVNGITESNNSRKTKSSKKENNLNSNSKNSANKVENTDNEKNVLCRRSLRKSKNTKLQELVSEDFDKKNQSNKIVFDVSNKSTASVVIHRSNEEKNWKVMNKKKLNNSLSTSKDFNVPETSTVLPNKKSLRKSLRKHSHVTENSLANENNRMDNVVNSRAEKSTKKVRKTLRKHTLVSKSSQMNEKDAIENMTNLAAEIKNVELKKSSKVLTHVTENDLKNKNDVINRVTDLALKTETLDLRKSSRKPTSVTKYWLFNGKDMIDDSTTNASSLSKLTNKTKSNKPKVITSGKFRRSFSLKKSLAQISIPNKLFKTKSIETENDEDGNDIIGVNDVQSIENKNIQDISQTKNLLKENIILEKNNHEKPVILTDLKKSGKQNVIKNKKSDENIEIPEDTLLLICENNDEETEKGVKRRNDNNEQDVISKKVRTVVSEDNYNFKKMAHLAYISPGKPKKGLVDLTINGNRNLLTCFGRFPSQLSVNRFNPDLFVGTSINNDFVSTGFLEIEPLGRKKYEVAKKVNVTLLVLEGIAEVGIGNSSQVLRIGQDFFIPKGIAYYIINVSNTDKLLIYFCRFYKT